MPSQSLKAAGTFNLKLSSAGYLQSLVCYKADGTTTSVAVNDGPDTSGNVRALVGSVAAIVPIIQSTAEAANLIGPQPLYFTNGLQIVLVAGTGVEVLATWQ
jgi:hypothetical protein